MEFDVLFFFFKQKTAYEMRISDWSSDVCSSDLCHVEGRTLLDVTLTEGRNRIVRRWCEAMGLKVERLARLSYGPVRLGDLTPGEYRPLTPREIGRASCRERVCQYV